MSDGRAQVSSYLPRAECVSGFFDFVEPAALVVAVRLVAAASSFDLKGYGTSGLAKGIDGPPLSHQQIAAQSAVPGHPVLR